MASGATTFVAGALCALVIGGGGAYAATGGNLVLGRDNTASRPTTLTSKQGPALSLRAPVGTPPLRVSNTAKVPRLNADRLDGLSAGSFARTAGRTGVKTATGAWVVEDGPQGCDETYPCPEPGFDYVFAAPQCPNGTMVTGGGFSGVPRTGRLMESRPDGNGWRVQVEVATADAAATDPSALQAYVTCYNPRGAVR